MRYEDHHYHDQYYPADTLYAEDFDEANRLAKNPFVVFMGKVGIGIAIIVFTLGFATITVLASKPQLTPHEIVQMEGYNGTSKQKTLFFNLASLRDCESLEDCTGQLQSRDSTMDHDSTAKKESTSLATQTGSIKARIVTASSVTAGSVQEASESTTESMFKSSEDYREIPAVASSSEPSQWLVKQQWSIVRDAPAMSGDIITSMRVDSRVRVLEKMGDWYQISYENNTGSKQSAQGFMHKSLLKPMVQ